MQRAEDIVREGIELYNKQQFVRAAKLAEGALVQFPEDGPIWQLQGLAQRQMQEFEKARHALEMASLLIPLDPVAECALADCYVKAGQSELAKQMYLHLASIVTCPTESLLPLAARLGMIGESEIALDLCREKWRREPRHHETLFGIAYYMRRTGHSLSAIIPVVRRAHELAPHVTPYRVLLASLLAEIGETEDAYAMLVRDVSPELIHCRCCLHRMLTIFRLAGDDAKCNECQKRIQILGLGQDESTG